ncbi:MAG: hypothetical protein IT422_05735 [Pirellulaceae bacterium]|jgi:hypothetical protein|nr:hypothetical protein [Pirellulaceae bacterium]
MLIPIAAPTRTRQTSARSRSLGYDFALLGLKVSESRVDVIRRAASHTAARIQRVASDDESEAAQMLSDLATSTYRLLDPRRRSKSRERIQLSIFDDIDFELQKGSRAPLFDSNWNALQVAAAAG